MTGGAKPLPLIYSISMRRSNYGEENTKKHMQIRYCRCISGHSNLPRIVGKRNMEEQKNTHGGKRAGAGRPKGIKKPYANIACSVPLEYSERLKSLAQEEGLSLSKMLQKIIDCYTLNLK